MTYKLVARKQALNTEELLDRASTEGRLDYWKKLLDWITDY
jgi:hypothetical protein